MKINKETIYKLFMDKVCKDDEIYIGGQSQ